MDRKTNHLTPEQWAKAIAIELFRGVVCYLSFIFVSFLISLPFIIAGEAAAEKQRFDVEYIYAISAIALPFSLYSTVRCFELYDKGAQRASAPEPWVGHSLRDRAKNILTEPTLRMKLLVHLACFVGLAMLFPYKFGYSYLVNIFYQDTAATVAEGRVVLLCTVVPLILLLLPVAKLSAHKWWRVARPEVRERILGVRLPKLRLALEMIKITAIYLVGFLVLPTTLGIIVTLALIAGLFAQPKFLIGFGAVILAIFLLVLYRIFKKRRRFYRRIKTALRENGYTLTAVHRPVLSAIIKTEKPNLEFERDGRKYSMRIMTLPYRRPSFFCENGTVTTKTAIKLLHFDLFFLMKDRPYDFDAEGSKIILLLPAPKRAYFNYGAPEAIPDEGRNGYLSMAEIGAQARAGVMGFNTGSSKSGGAYRGPGYVSDVDKGLLKPIQNGDKIGDYRFYSARGLISAIDNDVLDRKIM